MAARAEVRLVEPTRELIAHVAEHCRDADRAELWAAAHVTPLQAIETSLPQSVAPLVGLAGADILGICGVVPDLEDAQRAVPWFVSTPAVERHRVEFLRTCRSVLKVWSLRWPLLVNYVDARNRRAIAWLSRIGFSIDAPAPYGPDSLPFHRFEMRASCATR